MHKMKYYSCPVLAMAASLMLTACGFSKELDESAIREAIDKVAPVAADTVMVCYTEDYEGDGRAESYVLVGTQGSETEIAGDLWFVSQNREAVLVKEDGRWLSASAEYYLADDKCFLLLSHEEEEPDTDVYGVEHNVPGEMMWQDCPKYVSDVCIVGERTGHPISYDIVKGEFGPEVTQEYEYYYYEENMGIRLCPGRLLTEEEMAGYRNGAAVLQELEQQYSGAQFQYCERENAKLYINIADKQDNIILFYCRIYDITEQELTLLSEKEGCHRINMDAMGGISFEREIARQYGFE